MTPFKWRFISIVAILFLVGCATAGSVMSQVEIPTYTVTHSNENLNIEFRQYKPMIVAQTSQQGERSEAIGQGFRILADYIFGNNSINQDIAMTAPVEQQANQKIAMTAPVEQQKTTENTWDIRFIMPSEFTMATLPKPNNEAVKLISIPEKHLAVIRFSGLNTDEKLEEYEARLQSYLEQHNIPTTGSVSYAFYNPPWTLPFMRRNEIMIAVNPAAKP